MLGKRADAISAYLKKGTQLVVQGTLQQNRWQDKQTGQNRSRIEILADNVQFVGKKSDTTMTAEQNGINSSQTSGFNKNNESPTNVKKGGDYSTEDPFDNINFDADEEIPF